jgi:calcium-dependent protein kinase
MSDNNCNNQEDNFDENRGSLVFGDEGKIKPVNETSSFKGKSCFRKEKEKNKSKFAVKIKAPKQPQKEVTNEEVKERRKRRPQFQTVKEPVELKNKDILNLKNIQENKEDVKDEEQEEKKFVRKGKRSTTLIEKSKLGQKLIAAEMNVQVKQETLIIQEKGNPSKKYKPTKILGSGSFGSVYEAKNTIFQNTVAMKVIKKDPNNEIDEQEIKNEIDILKKLSHPNIVKIYEFYISNSHYYIITEFCKEGELFNYIKNKYSERQLAVLFYQVFSGLWYLHENKILHRDIKLENIMISGKENDNSTGEELFWAKIIDFGTAKIFEKNKKEKDVVGSSYYIAPEVLKQNYNEKCDTWSVGVILYMTLVGRAPFDGKDDEEIINKINTVDYNKNEPRLVKHSPEVRDLVSKLLEKNIEKRYSAKEALAHPWFEKFGGRALFSNFEESEIKPFINNLLNYSFNSKIQLLVIAFLVHNLPSTDSSILILKLFRHFNKSGNCKLSKEELTNGLYAFRSKEEVDKIIDKLFIMLDGDNDGFVEYEEFLRACINKKQILTSTYLKYAFKFIDKDKTNTLNVQKIINAFVTTPNKLLEAVFNNTLISVDKDGDGVIGFEEFQELMLKCMN